MTVPTPASHAIEKNARRVVNLFYINRAQCILGPEELHFGSICQSKFENFPNYIN